MDKMRAMSPVPERENGRICPADREGSSKPATRRIQRRRLSQLVAREMREMEG